jgi:hypothetical protein
MGKFRDVSRIGMRRVDRELDIVYFIRKSLMLTAVLKAHTTKKQRSLAYQNYSYNVFPKWQLDSQGKPIGRDPKETTSDESSSNHED